MTGNKVEDRGMKMGMNVRVRRGKIEIERGQREGEGRTISEREDSLEEMQKIELLLKMMYEIEYSLEMNDN